MGNSGRILVGLKRMVFVDLKGIPKVVDRGGVEPPSPQCECGALPDKLMAQFFNFLDYFINSLVNYHFFLSVKWE